MALAEINIEFQPIDPWREIAISILSENGFDGFIETKLGLTTYIDANLFSEALMQDVVALEGVKDWSWKPIEEQNWNASWESNFDPVFVEDKLAIVAPFHQGPFDQKMIVTIQPQMSFGTGHHQTTWMMSRKLFDLDLTDKTVLDMGTGTGVLAIVAEKLGAQSVYAPDIDQWSYDNAISNVELNHCNRIQVALGGDELLDGMNFDLILANINKNTLIEHFSVYSKVLREGGILLLSGFFSTDCDSLIEAAKNHNFEYVGEQNRDEWAMLEFVKV